MKSHVITLLGFRFLLSTTMQRLDSNVEEQMIAKAIEDEANWDKLPKRLKLYLQSSEEWHKKIKDYCIKNRLRWSESLAKNTCKESDYYDELMRYLRRNSALFPYHLSDYVCRILRVSPFQHYCDMLYEALKDERPYDSIPNFSAADALRVTGIGRNEYIDVLNKCRAKKIMWRINKSFAKDLLPSEPADICIEAWWIINVVNLSQDEIRKLSEEESILVEKVCEDDVARFGEHDPFIVRGLYRRGFVYFDVPVSPDDHFQVLTLEGFVSNQNQNYEDPTEELLYAVFITSSEHATIAELASTLQADFSKLEAAVSLAARLGWAKKRVDPAALLSDPNEPGSPSSDFGDDDPTVALSPVHRPSENQGEPSTSDAPTELPGVVRFAFLVDADLTSYLMMGSLSPRLKGHAVTLYEAGKLGDSHVIEMCEDLRKVEGTECEGELQHFADHAFSLRHALECLRSGGSGILDDVSFNKENFDNAKKVRVDVVRCESLSGLAAATIQRVFRRDYDVIVSMIPLPSRPAVISSEGGGPVHFGPPSRAATTPWMKLLLYSVAGAGPVSVALIRGQRLRMLPESLSRCYKALVWTWGDGTAAGGPGGKFEGTLVEGGVLLHVVNTLLKHSAVVVQPYSKESFQGGEKAELVTKDIALPLYKPDSAGQALSQAVKELHLNTMGYVRLVSVVSETTTSGSGAPVWQWVPQSIEFGLPLFNTALCKLVCEGVVKCGLFDSDALARHDREMWQLHSKLQDFISDYQADGPVSRLAYSAVQETPSLSESPRSTTSRSSSTPLMRRLQSEKGSIDENTMRTYTLSAGEDQFSPSPKGAVTMFVEQDEDEIVPLPGVNLVFNGSWLAALDISPCLQGKLPASLLVSTG
ncbi:protein FAM91A1 [Selaginella moellendorffii]|uniref:protein FAM91A1 n=1 Tax=Selaginella moellendorffii TaxID=88036 RepID=UPI000D1CFC64|nr:protein FAM91A1 [Selaginella moellendorffii]|eukprot:XP_024521965.1 protein FAM91A1 [Selaginella moellendorffii]